MHISPRCIIAVWNANSIVRDLNSCLYLHFLRWWYLNYERLHCWSKSQNIQIILLLVNLEFHIYIYMHIYIYIYIKREREREMCVLHFTKFTYIYICVCVCVCVCVCLQLTYVKYMHICMYTTQYTVSITYILSTSYSFPLHSSV